MTLGRHFLIWFLILILQFLVVMVMVSPEEIYHNIKEERVLIDQVMGKDMTRHIIEDSNNWMSAGFEDTGVVAFTYNVVTPGGFETMHDLNDDGIFGSLQEMMKTFWATVYQTFQRLLIIIYWIPYLSVLIFPAIVDGFVKRRIKVHEAGWCSPVRYHASLHGLVALFFIPLIYLSLPVPLSPWAIPIWMALSALMVSFFVSNIQKRM